MMILENSLGENKRIDHVYKNYALNTIILYFLKIFIKFRTPHPPLYSTLERKVLLCYEFNDSFEN